MNPSFRARIPTNPKGPHRSTERQACLLECGYALTNIAMCAKTITKAGDMGDIFSEHQRCHCGYQAWSQVIYDVVVWVVLVNAVDNPHEIVGREGPTQHKRNARPVAPAA